ncbi:YeeE/YedE family protein [Bizionia myxarmorum]|uniref:YeeE/YedE family protein n=1 Tax=Bizionia myxarmorum TaxID=291186 RepID=A0A5D0RC80_9FLAO|nr:YeeE/YedE thiosulfate transporter family protein [Bizionia myxarmorum]TYB79157.1 YeeE/YedE family protein [Bizionia myxarmorum]
MAFFLEPWPWYFSGFMIAFVMFLLIMVDKRFGMSSNLRTLCSMAGAGNKTDFFDFDWKSQRWNLVVVIGAVIGGFIASEFLSPNDAVAISENTISDLKTLGFESAGLAYMPTELFGNDVFTSWKGILVLIIGGFLVGFGARYAGGCTSGHAISGLSNLQLPSLIAVIGFFLGGLIMVHLVFPLIF